MAKFLNWSLVSKIFGSHAPTESFDQSALSPRFPRLRLSIRLSPPDLPFGKKLSSFPREPSMGSELRISCLDICEIVQRKKLAWFLRNCTENAPRFVFWLRNFLSLSSLQNGGWSKAQDEAQSGKPKMSNLWKMGFLCMSLYSTLNHYWYYVQEKILKNGNFSTLVTNQSWLFKDG